jgi:hypothetical protein
MTVTDNKKGNGKIKKVCAWCGGEFQADSPLARYCNNAHKQAAYRARKKHKEQPQTEAVANG